MGKEMLFLFRFQIVQEELIYLLAFLALRDQTWKSVVFGRKIIIIRQGFFIKTKFESNLSFCSKPLTVANSAKGSLFFR